MSTSPEPKNIFIYVNSEYQVQQTNKYFSCSKMFTYIHIYLPLKSSHSFTVTIHRQIQNIPVKRSENSEISQFPNFAQ